jgi:putative membrane protein
MRSVLIRLIGAAGLALALLPGTVWAQAPSDAERYAWGPHIMWWGGGWYAMIFGSLFMILLLALLIAAVILFVRWLGWPWQGTMPTHHAPPGRTPLDILKERFARGEIDKEEFEERRRVLGERALGCAEQASLEQFFNVGHRPKQLHWLFGKRQKTFAFVEALCILILGVYDHRK